MPKISQIKLTNQTYNLDVASELKATTIINESDVKKVATVEAVKTPDGTHSLFDENNKIASAYLSDTILGQLKFGGTICCDLAKSYHAGLVNWSITPSTLLKQKIQEELYEYEDSNLLTLAVGVASGISFGSSVGLYTSDINFLEGFYFIMSASDPEVVSSEGLVPSFVVGDWMLICDNQIQKIDNTDTITHIADANTSLLSIEGSGLKLNGITAVHPDYSDTVIDQVNIDAPISVSYGMTYIGSDIINYYGGKIQTGPDDGLDKSTLTPGYLNIKADTAHIKVTQSTGELGTHTEITPRQFSIKTINQENGVAEANTFMAPGEISTSGSISGQEVHAELKMTAPTITNKTDKSQVVNLEYFENNATKVDWENIDSEVHVINNHSVEIDGNLTVGELLSTTKTSTLTEYVTATYAEWEPASFESPAVWKETAADQPNFYYFPVKAGASYMLGGGIYDDVNAALDNGIDFYSTILFYQSSPLVGTSIAPIATGVFTKEDTYVSYTVTSTGFSGGWQAPLTFTSSVSGVAYIAHYNTVPEDHLTIVEVFNSSDKVKINGDLEVTGDLSFGADSHIVFGTIEGTDFIADSAKVKNAPTEDDDVINKAYFDANKGSGTGIPAPEETSELPSELNSDYLVLSDIGEVNNLDWRTGTYTGILDPKATYELYLEAADGTWIKGILPTVSDVYFRVTDWTAGTCRTEGWVNGMTDDTGYVNLDKVTRRADGFYDLQISFTNCCWQPVKVTITKTGGTTPVSMDGAFLRWRNGQAVWEMLSNAENYTF